MRGNIRLGENWSCSRGLLILPSWGSSESKASCSSLHHDCWALIHLSFSGTEIMSNLEENDFKWYETL